MSKRQRRANLNSFLIGLIATVGVIVLYAGDQLDWLEYKTLDWRFRYANPLTETERIVCVDIDDEALALVGRWPWSRDIQAQLLDLLAEAGARRILYDIALHEPEPVRSLAPRAADLATNPLTLAQAGITSIFPDYELRRALEDGAPTYLAFDYRSDSFLRGTRFRSLCELARSGATGEPHELADVVAKHAGRAIDADVVLRCVTVTTRLEHTTPWAVAADSPLNHDMNALAPDLRQECIELSLEHRARQWLATLPAEDQRDGVTLFSAFCATLGVADDTGAVAYEESIARALRRVLGEIATVRDGLVPLEEVAAVAQSVGSITPVYFTHAQAAERCGFVVFEPDDDGVTRRMRLLVNYAGHVLPQLAFTLAFDELELTAGDITAQREKLTIRRQNEPPLVIQLDGQGRTLIPWVPQRNWAQQFGQHVPAGMVWQILDRRLAVRNNDELIATQLATLVELPAFAPHAQYAEDLRARLELDGKWRAARYIDDTETADDYARYMAEYDRLLPAGEQALRATLNELLSHWSTSAPALSADEQTTLHAALLEVQRAYAATDQFRREIDDTLRRLQGRIDGRICLIGYTATALADMTPIPLHPRVPGVIAHANLLNGLFTGRMVHWAPVRWNVFLAGALGVLASLVSFWRRPREAAVIVLGMIVVFVGLAGWWAFYAKLYWIAIVPGVGAMLVSHFAIAGYRYLFLDRERRALTRTLSQYTSATLARKMAEDAELCRRAEVRTVSVIFTDLRGFTPISERIGAERTQRVLNVCLGRCSDVLLQYEAMINKFIGDGIFAFWNPVIYPQTDHAERACHAAALLHSQLAKLAEEQRQASGDPVFDELVLRVGVATGTAVVGPCGSEQKYDYTCIGDTVNLASRLESANKFFGTQTLVAGATHDAAPNGFVWRHLGGVQVKGKREPVPVYELLGMRDDVDEARVAYARQFERGVEEFQQRDWLAAHEIFAACYKSNAQDLAAERYAAITQTFITSPPAEGWIPALELTEK